jgi:hypothetical protein
MGLRGCHFFPISIVIRDFRDPDKYPVPQSLQPPPIALAGRTPTGCDGATSCTYGDLKPTSSRPQTDLKPTSNRPPHHETQQHARKRPMTCDTPLNDVSSGVWGERGLGVTLAHSHAPKLAICVAAKNEPIAAPLCRPCGWLPAYAPKQIRAG